MYISISKAQRPHWLSPDELVECSLTFHAEAPRTQTSCTAEGSENVMLDMMESAMTGTLLSIRTSKGALLLLGLLLLPG